MGMLAYLMASCLVCVRYYRCCFIWLCFFGFRFLWLMFVVYYGDDLGIGWKWTYAPGGCVGPLTPWRVVCREG